MPLKPEAAEKRLDAWKVKNPVTRITSRIRKLPKTLQMIAFGLLRKGPDGKDFKDWQHGHQAHQAANLAVEKLSPPQRTRLFAAFFPHLAEPLTAAWASFDRLPYQMDGDRKAFRAPNNPLASVERKGDWFSDVRNALDDFHEDIVTLPWCATWAAYLGYGGADELGILFATALDLKLPDSEEVFQILVDSVTNRHEIAAMGRHVTRALLISSRKDGWELMEKTLLAAQRQEGLRQSILETVDEAHPQAFRRMVKLVLEKDLLRFSSAARAIDVWFGLGWDMGTTAQFKKALKSLNELLDSAKARKAALASADPETVYFSLIVHAFEDAEATVPLSEKLLKHKNFEHRYVALRALEAIALPATVPSLVSAFADPEVKLALQAVSAIFAMPDDTVNAAVPDLFERLEAVLQRMPDKQLPHETLVSWTVEYPSKDDLADALGNYLGKRSASRLTPYIPMMSPWRRRNQIEELAKAKPIAPASRALFFEFVSDRSDDVREVALKAIAKCKPTPDEVRDLEPILTRKSESARRGVLSLIQKQKPAVVLETADRLLTSKNGNVRLGGLELLRVLSRKEKTADTAKERAATFRDAGKRNADETRVLDEILHEKREEAGPVDAFGLCDLSSRTRAPKPVAKNVTFVTPAAIGIVMALDELIHEHRETPVKYKAWDGIKEELLGTVTYGFPSPDPRRPIEKDMERFLLREVWENFWKNRPAALRDKDGFELIRALAVYRVDEWDWNRMREEAKSRPSLKKLTAKIFGDFKVLKRRYHFIDDILEWLLALYPVSGNINDFLLDGLETIYSQLTIDDLRATKKSPNRLSLELLAFWNNAFHAGPPLTPEQRNRRFFLDKWFDEPFPGLVRDRVNLVEILEARVSGWVTVTDLYDSLLGPRTLDENDDDDEEAENRLLNARYNELVSFTGKSPPWEKPHAAIFAPIAERIRARLLELELARGDLPTPATAAILCVDCFFGIDTLAKLLSALAGKPFKRGGGYYWNRSLDRTRVLTHLIEHTHPTSDDTPERFAEVLRPLLTSGAVSEDRLLDLAFLAPQWLSFVEHLLGWPGVSEGVWWFLAHMPGGQEGVEDDEEEEEEEEEVETESETSDEADTDEELETPEKPERKSAWERLIAQRTPLTEEERAEGAVDVTWFHRTYAVVGAANWAKLAVAAKCGGSGQDWKKPTQLADVLLGKAKKSDLVHAVRVRKLKESVRLLGLMPITEGTGREKDLKDRYEVLQEYARYARSLGSMSRAAAVRQGEIGLANLARTAGFPDPVRFEWEMEAESVADLAAGPQEVSVTGVTVTLALEEGKPIVTVAKNGKPLKAIPPAVKKHEKIAELTARKQHLTRQASRVKKSLEAMMCRGDEFSGSELKKLMLHPILAPVLGRLVIVGEGIAGFPVEKGLALEDHTGKLEPVKPAEKLRIAHSSDLYAAGNWDRWQHNCFTRERVQPFKQVFRELYLLTDQEKSDGSLSHRYAGQQVQPRQGAALLNSRGWSTQDFTRTFHEAGIRVTFTVHHGGWTPLDVEGWTLEDIRFYRRGEWKPMPLAEVPPRIFSESMRDLDLIVSVAHMGQIDPEASASTTEMRAALLRETTQLLRLGNVRVENKHVLIDGSLGQYSVHLGSGTVHRLPGGSICIVPVYSQHRGRLFLPFADDDPRTAEVVSKVLLLARDGEIQDPGILQQLLNT